MQWRKTSLIGVGLLGGSLGLAIKRRGLAGRVEGYVRRPESVGSCMAMAVADSVSLDLEDVVSEAELIVLCTPISQMRPLAEAMLGFVSPGAVITDVGSVKGSVVRELSPIFKRRGATFVGSHPMAGSERMGVGEAKADLFQGAACVVTPTADLPEPVVARVESLWSGVGGIAMRLDPDWHDELVCRSSHLPHLLAATLAHFVLDGSAPAELGRLCAGGFRDTTRIASGSPQMWRDICVANRGRLTENLGQFLRAVEGIRCLMEPGKEEELEAFFEETKRRRDRWQASARNDSPE